MPDTTVRVEYIGAVQNFSEVTITGNQQVWRIGSSAFVETGRASQLVASGNFRYLANDPAMLPANQAKVGAIPSSGVVEKIMAGDKDVTSQFGGGGSVAGLTSDGTNIAIGATTPEGFRLDVGGSSRASGLIQSRSNIVTGLEHALVEMYNFRAGGIKANNELGALKFSGNSPTTGYETHCAYIQATATGDWTDSSKPTNLIFSCRIPGAADSQAFAYSDEAGWLRVTTGFLAGQLYSGSAGSGKAGVNVNPASMGAGWFTIDAYNYNVELLTFKARNQTSASWGFYAYNQGGLGIQFRDQAGVQAFCVDGNRRVGVGTTTTAPVAQLHTTSIAKSIATKAISFTLSQVTDHAILADATSAARTITLPAAAGVSGIEYCIKKTDSSANTVTLQANGAETIDGANTYVLSAQWSFVRVQCNGTGWFIVGKG